MVLQTIVSDLEPAFDFRWESSYDLDNHSADSRFEFSLHYVGKATNDSTIGNVIGSLSVDSDLPDTRATWHRNYTPLAPWIRAYVLKQAMGWNGETQLADHSEEHPELAMEYGFVDSEPTAGSETVCPDPPAQSRFWEMWHEEFGDDLRAICRDIASQLVELAREEGIPAPDDVFQPDDKQNASERSETRLIADTTKEVWQHAKPFVTDEFFLKRGDNARFTRTPSGSNTRSWGFGNTCSQRAVRTASMSILPALRRCEALDPGSRGQFHRHRTPADRLSRRTHRRVQPHRLTLTVRLRPVDFLFQWGEIEIDDSCDRTILRSL